MPTLSKLLRDVAACMATGYLGVALFHPSAKASPGLVAGGILAAFVLVGLAANRARPGKAAPADASDADRPEAARPAY